MRPLSLIILIGIITLTSTMNKLDFCLTMAIGNLSIAIGYLSKRKPYTDTAMEQKRQLWIRLLKASAAALNEIVQSDKTENG